MSYKANSNIIKVSAAGVVGANGLIVGNPDTTAKDTSAALEVESTTGGLLFPRLTTTQRNNISSSSEGLVVYNTDRKLLEIKTNSRWEIADSTPTGAVLSWVGGYFTNNANSGFTSVLGNTIASVNALLNNKGWYVCDGSALQLAESPIFNDINRYLPNLTDNRFLEGSTTAGSIGGQNNVVLSTSNLPSHSHTIDHNHGTHTHSIDHDHGPAATGAHTHTVDKVATSGSSQGISYTIGAPTTDWVTSSTTPSIDLPSFAGTSGGAAISISTSSGLTGSGSSYENRPQYLSVFYIMKVI